MNEIVTADIGGTHARFAIAKLDGNKVRSLEATCTLKTNEHASLEMAWEAFARQVNRALPSSASIAIAGPIRGEVLKLTNNPWSIRPSKLPRELGLKKLHIINDFGAVGHAVAQVDKQHFQHVCGLNEQLPEHGITTVIGPGTGLGVAQVLRAGEDYQVIETEGGHIDFAPLDPLEDRILAELRPRFRRVSVERMVSGMGLMNIYEVLSSIDGFPRKHLDEKTLWAAAIGGEDKLAAAALDRFFLIFGAVAGDMALAHGSDSLVIAGGLGHRLAASFNNSGFRHRFAAKGRFEPFMSNMPVRLITHPEPGLFGAAAAFARMEAG